MRPSLVRCDQLRAISVSTFGRHRMQPAINLFDHGLGERFVAMATSVTADRHRLGIGEQDEQLRA